MQGTIAWTWSAKAFEASRSERFPRPLKHVLVRTGVMCFWAALALERRAMEVWREQRAQRALLPASRTGSVQRWIERARELLSWSGRARCYGVSAWSLPDSAKMRGLGIGRMWAVLCP